MRRPMILAGSMLLVVVCSVLAVAFAGRVKRLILDDAMAGKLRSVYQCCEVYFQEKQISPRDTKDLISFAEANKYNIVGPLQDHSILYYPVGGDRWALVLVRPTTNLKVLERVGSGNRYTMRWYYSKGNGVVLKDFGEHE